MTFTPIERLLRKKKSSERSFDKQLTNVIEELNFNNAEIVQSELRLLNLDLQNIISIHQDSSLLCTDEEFEKIDEWFVAIEDKVYDLKRVLHRWQRNLKVNSEVHLLSILDMTRKPVDFTITSPSKEKENQVHGEEDVLKSTYLDVAHSDYDRSAVPHSDAAHPEIARSKTVCSDVDRPKAFRAEVPSSEVVCPQVTRSVVIHPEVVCSDVIRPQIARAEVVQPEVTRSKFVPSEVARAEAARSEVVRYQSVHSEINYPEVVRPEVSRSEVARPEVARLEVVRPEIARPKVVHPEVVRSEVVCPEVARTEGVPSEFVRPKVTHSPNVTKAVHFARSKCFPDTSSEVALLNVVPAQDIRSGSQVYSINDIESWIEHVNTAIDLNNRVWERWKNDSETFY